MGTDGEEPSAGLIGLLDGLVFGKEHVSGGSVPTSEAKKAKPEDAEDNDEDKGASRVDILANKRLRRQKLVTPDYTQPDRLPAKRFLTEREFEERVQEKIAPSAEGGMTWVELSRQKKQQQKGLVISASSHRVALKELTPKQKGVMKLIKHPDPTAAGNNRHKSKISSIGFRLRDDIGRNLLLYSTGPDRVIKFYDIGPGGESECLTSTEILKSPIWKATWSSDKSRVYSASDRGQLFSIDVETRSLGRLPPLVGRDWRGSIKAMAASNGNLCILDERGKIYNVDERTNRAVRIFNSGTVNESIVLDPKSRNRIYSGDCNGELFVWDLSMGRCVSRTVLDGVLAISGLTYLSAEGHAAKLLVGAKSGYVSLHEVESTGGVKSDSLKSFRNLAGSPVDVMCSSRELALIASSETADKVRLCECDEKPFVYQNWPGENPKLKRITAAAMSDQADWLAVANDHGVVRLWSLPERRMSRGT